MFARRTRLLLAWTALWIGFGSQIPVCSQGSLSVKDFDTSRPPRGVVLDVDGQPVVGVTVSFRVARADSDVAWRNAILRRQPLPKVRTSRDGEFFIPLTQNHRLLGRNTSGDISLLVEKEGYVPWVEPLTAGLRGYLGSRVVLRRTEAADRFVVEVKNPKIGMWVRVHRFGNGRQAGLDFDRWLKVPASGEVEVVMPRVPSPPVTGVRSNFANPMGITVQLLFPGRSSRPMPVEFGARRVVIPAKASTNGFVCVVRGADGKAPRRSRGLYRCPDGVSRWFPVDAENVVESSMLPLGALIADGHLALDLRYEPPRRETARLQAIEETQASLLLVDAAGKPVEEASATFFDLRFLPMRDDEAALGPERGRRRLRVREGKLDLSATTFPGPGFLWIEAPGREPVVFFEPRRVQEEKRVRVGKMVAKGGLTLTVVDLDDRPVAGAFVVLPQKALRLGSEQQVFRSTDAQGRLELTDLPPGSLKLQVIGQGIATLNVTHVVRKKSDQIRAVASRSGLLPIALVDENEKPLPFRMVRVYATVQGQGAVRVAGRLSTSRVNSYLSSDSLGRICLSDLALGVTPRVTDALSSLAATHPQQGVQERPEILSVQLQGLVTALMPLPAPVVRECYQATNRSASRTVVSPAAARWVMVRYPMGQPDLDLAIYLRDKAPLRLNAEVVAAARKRQPVTGRELVIDQRTGGRRIELAVAGFGDADFNAVRPERPGLNFASNRPALRGDSGLRLRAEKPDRWSFEVRDIGGFDLKILHPDFLLADVEIPESERGKAQPPIPVRLERGTAVRFQVKSTTPLRDSMRCMVYVYTEQNSQILYQRETLAELRARKIRPGLWELRLPMAFAPGKYRFQLRITGTSVNMPRTLMTVPKTSPLIIHVDRRKGRVVVTEDRAALLLSIEKLEATAKALRASPPARDAKSRASLKSVLERTEAQLKATRAALKKLDEKAAAEAKGKPKQPDRKGSKAPKGAPGPKKGGQSEVLPIGRGGD